MARFLVEILINAAGGPKARASFDDVGAAAASSAKRVSDSSLQSERALRRTAEAAARLNDQMEETKASKGLITDLTSLNAKLSEHLRAVRDGAAGIDRLNKKQHEEALAARITTAQVKAGVSAHSEQGRAIASLIREHDRLQSELRQTQTAQSSVNVEVRGLGQIASSVLGPLKGLVAGYLGFQAVQKYITDTVKAVVEAEDATAQLQARIRAFGSVSGQGLGQLTNEADRLSIQLGIDDEAVIQLQASLARFDAIDTPALFNRTTRAAIDLAAATTEAGQSIESGFAAAAETLGKFASEPDEALSQLEKRVGKFTDAEEQLILKTAKAGDEAGALTIALGILESRVGDTADELRDSLGGSFRALGVEWEALQEDLAEGANSGILREFAEGGIEAIRTLRENLFLLRATWLGVLEDINRALATYLEGMAKVLSASRFVGNLSGGQGADFLREQVAGLNKEADRLAGIQENVINAGTGLSGVFGEVGEEARKTGRDHRQLGKDMTSALDSVNRMVEGIKGEAQQKKSLLAILKQEGVSQQDLIKQYREAEIAQKADAKVAEIRAAYLKAGKTLTEENAKAIRGWVIEAEKAGDAASKWLKNLAPTSLPLIEIKVKPRLVGLEVVTDEMNWVIDQLGKIEDIRLSNQSSIDEHNQAIYDDLLDQAVDFKNSLVSPREALRDFQQRITELEEVTDSAGNAILSAADAERLRAQAAEQFATDQLNTWTGFLSYLGDAFGGFFAEVASMARSVQSVNSTAQSLGGWSSAMGAWGGTIAAFVEIYKYADSIIQRNKGERYGTRGSVATVGGSSASSYFDHESMVLSRSISDVIKAFEDQLRISATDLAAIEIRIRNNGESVQAWVKGQWIGTFTDVNTAIREAVLASMSDPESSFRGMSDLMAQGLADWRSPDMEGLLDSLGKLREISDLNLSPAVIDLHRAFMEFNSLRDALNKLDQSTQTVIDAQRDLTEAQNRLYEQAKAQLMGIDLSMADAVRNLAGFQKGMAAVSDTAREGIESAIRAAEEQLARLERAEGKVNERPTGVGGAGPGTEEGGVPGSVARFFSDLVGEIDDEKGRLKEAIDGWKKQLGEVPKALTDEEIDLGIFTALEDALRRSGKHADLIAKFERMRVDAQFQALKLQLIAVGAWERWADIWQELYNQAMTDAGRPVTRGGGGSSDKDQVRDFIKDKKFELRLEGLTDYQKALKELERQYQTLLEQAGNDNKLRAELIALREKEMAILKEQEKQDLAARFKSFLGLDDPFQAIRDNAAKLIKDIENSPFGDERKARMIGRILADVERQIEALSRETARGLLSEMLGDLEKFGADESLMAEVRRNMAILEHTIKMAHYQAEIELLKAQGKLAPEVVAALDKAFNFLKNVDPLKLLGPSGANGPRFRGYDDNVIDAGNRFGDALKRATDLLKKYTDDGLSPLERNLRQIQEDFVEIIRGMGATPQVLQAREDAIRRAITDAFGGLQDTYNRLIGGDRSGMTTGGQWQSAQMDYFTLLTQLRGQDFTNAEDLDEIVNRLLDLGGEMYGTSTGGYQALRQQLINELGPLLNGTGIDITAILNRMSGSGTGPQSMVPALTANNDANTGRVVGATQNVANLVDITSRRQENLLNEVVSELSALRTGSIGGRNSGSTNWQYGT